VGRLPSFYECLKVTGRWEAVAVVVGPGRREFGCVEEFKSISDRCLTMASRWEDNGGGI
jgi:hypothetical protein